jgi:6-phosphogluconolactonase (cycloisomerase 2 family)
LQGVISSRARAFHPSGKYAAIIVGLEGTILTYDGVQTKEIAKLNKRLRALSWKSNGVYA